jgi:parallel beta-helix repeat protein
MRKFVVVGFATICGIVVLAAHASAASRAVTVTPNAHSPTAGIQEAVDALPPDGGVVTIPAGEYLLRQPIRVRSGVTLQGAGEKTVLRKNKQVGSKLTALTMGRTVQVEDATGFQVGDAIGFFDRTTVGWLHGQAIVTGVEGNQLLLNKNPGGKFDPANGGAVVNYFPAISGRDVTKVVLKDLTIDGRAEENPGPALVSERAKGKPPELSFIFAAVDLIRVSDSRVENVRVKGWPADGISVQGQGSVQGKYSGNVVTRCVVENCRAEGFHAGGRLEDSEFTENEARGNLGNGFYFCAWVTRITVRNNKFIGNQGNGVGGLGDSGDTRNLVENNLCRANGKNGIALGDGQSNTVRNNICINNSQEQPGRYSGISLSKTENSIVTGNRCVDDQQIKTQKHGIEELANCRANTLHDNDCRGNARSDLVLSGKDDQQGSNRE